MMHDMYVDWDQASLYFLQIANLFPPLNLCIVKEATTYKKSAAVSASIENL
jgi:hypothetical protein